MNAINTKYLLDKYPNLYQQHKLPMSQTSMCWLFECGDGWLNLLDELSEKISKLDSKCQAVQVKEKFGGLRFYIDITNDEVYKIIDEYEKKSYKICEECGSTENVTQTQGWITTLCKIHKQ